MIDYIKKVSIMVGGRRKTGKTSACVRISLHLFHSGTSPLHGTKSQAEVHLCFQRPRSETSTCLKKQLAADLWIMSYRVILIKGLQY